MIRTVDAFGPPLTIDRIREAERALKLRFPDDYISFLLQFNGGVPEPDGFSVAWPNGGQFEEMWASSAVSRLYSIGFDGFPDLVEENQNYEGGLPAGTFSIGMDAAGNEILIDAAGAYRGKVLFWVLEGAPEDGVRPTYANCGIVADSFTQFLESLVDY
jgi:hypothetical protein